MLVGDGPRFVKKVGDPPPLDAMASTDGDGRLSSTAPRSLGEGNARLANKWGC